MSRVFRSASPSRLRFAPAWTLAALFLAVATASLVHAQGSSPLVEVLQAEGIIDGSVERALLAGIEEAEEQDAALVVVQIDSNGVLDERRTDRLGRALDDADVPVVTWIGPPGAGAANGAALVATSTRLRAMAPGSVLGPLDTLDLRHPDISDRDATVFDAGITATTAEDEGVVSYIAPSIDELLTELEEKGAIDIDADDASVRFHQLDLIGRMLHAVAQPSITYLLLLLGLVGIVFEVFHPSTGPAGISGLAALALGCYGVATLGASWVGVVLIVAGVAAFGVDLRYASLGAFTAGGLAALIAGSLLLFRSPFLRPSPWVLAFGIVAMTMFLVGAMTRVLRDLRAVARGELEVTDAHPHHDGEPHET